MPIFRVESRCVESRFKKFNVRVIGDIDRHMLKSFESSLRAAACVWRGLCLSSECCGVWRGLCLSSELRAAACVWRGLCLSSELTAAVLRAAACV